jgi:hypothetical protein
LICTATTQSKEATMKRSLSYMFVAMLAGCGGNGDSSRNPTGVAIDGGEPILDAAMCSMALPATLQAEDARRVGGAVAADRPGFQGNGYVTGFAEPGDRVIFSLCIPEAGYYTLEFRYAAGAQGGATRTVLVDGKPFAVAARFLPMASSVAWSDGGRQSMFIDAGQHELALAFQPSDGGDVQIDSMTLTPGPSSSQTSVRSLFMNNWQDLVVAWHAAKLHPADRLGFGPRMVPLHSKIDWPTNQIDEAQAFFRDDTGASAFDDPNRFDTTAFLTASDAAGYGELDVEYNSYDGKALPVSVTRRQIVPPGEPVILVLYDLVNVSGGTRDFSLLEWVDLHNKTAGPSEDPADTGMKTTPTGTLHAAWQPASNAWVVDMISTNGTAMVVGALDAMDHHVAGLPVTGGPDRGAATVQQFFRAPASLADSVSFADTDAGVGLSKTVHLQPGERTTLAFFYAVTDSVAAANAAATAANGMSAATLSAESSTRWKAWLDSGKAASAPTPMPAWVDALRVVLLTTRQAQQPEFGTFAAATNPAYFYSIWPRDSSVTSMGLDAAGYLAEAEKYWTWMASVQEQGVNKDYPKGTYYTNYNFWYKQLGIRFVYPEWDSTGLFLVGVYRHYLALAATDAQHASAFLSQVWPAVQGGANFIEMGSMDPNNHGFGPQDNSIWEEDLAYQAFTQTTYVAGLRAAELLAAKRGEDGSHWGAASDQIRGAIFRPTSTTPCPGLWSDQGRYFIRSVKPDCKTDARVDSATQLLWVFGVLAQDDPAAADHRRAVLFNLSPGDWGFGIARYERDEFYHANPASPGGMFEAGAATPVWPQATMEMTMLEHWHGLDMLATDRLSWDVATTPTGFEPQGESVDWSTQQPLVSTASEPVTGAWFVLGLMNQLGLFDPRLPPRDTWGRVANTPYPRY